jgi:hypothetical protein
MYLGVWSLGYQYTDKQFDVVESATVDGRTVTFWDYSTTSTPYRKYFVSGNVNLTGSARQDGDSKTETQNILMSSDDEFTYKSGYFQTGPKTNTDVVSLEANSDSGVRINLLTKWSDYTTQAIWDSALKYYAKFEQASIPLRGNGSVWFQVFMESFSDTKIRLIDFRGDSTP